MIRCTSIVVFTIFLLIPSCFSNVKKKRKSILPEERTPFQLLKDPEGHFLGFYEDDNKVQSKFHYYYSAWQEDEYRDKVHRLNNRHAGDDFHTGANAISEEELRDSEMVLTIIYIAAITMTWLPYAIAVFVRAMIRFRRLRQERRERELLEELLRNAPDRESRKSLDPANKHDPGPRRSIGGRIHRHTLNYAGSNHEIIDLSRKSSVVEEFTPVPEKRPSRVKFDIKTAKLQQDSETFSVAGVRRAIGKVMGFPSNQVGPMDGDTAEKCDPYPDDPLSDESDDGGEANKGEFKVQIEPITSTTWAESDNEADVDTSNSDGEESEDEGSMWTYWKKLRQRSKKKPEYEDYSKYFTNTLW